MSSFKSKNMTGCKVFSLLKRLMNYTMFLLRGGWFEGKKKKKKPYLLGGSVTEDNGRVRYCVFPNDEYIRVAS